MMYPAIHVGLRSNARNLYQPQLNIAVLTTTTIKTHETLNYSSDLGVEFLALL